MKKLRIYFLFLLSLTLFIGCKKEGNYPGGVVSPYISILDIKDLYKGEDVSLTREKMYGSSSITAMVVSDHSGGNMPTGLLVVQEARRLSQLRGMAINIGAEAANYLPGDSVTINLEGGVLKRVNGILQVTGVPGSAVTKISSGNAIPVNRVASNLILADPAKYESVLVVIVKGGFNPTPVAGDILAGDKVLNDAFGNLNLHTEATAKFANSTPIFLGNYTGIVFNTVQNNTLVPQFRLRTSNDIVLLSSTVEVTPVIITGFINDVAGTDAPYEYIQLMATRNINFAATPFSVVVTNNANASAPTGAPINGWGTGGMRTFKFNLTSGSAAKGTFFYVGGSEKRINGSASTSIANANWIRAFDYNANNGDGGVGTKTAGLFANSGNASGIAVFEGTTVDLAKKPVDVLFVATGGSLFSAGPPARGYRIANTDWYDIKNPITLEDQPFYRQGSNTLSMAYITGTYFHVMGGEYNVSLGRWMKARSNTNLLLTNTSTIDQIEGEGATVLK
jgi:hypothetical protein